MSAYDFTDTLAVQILTYKKEHNETAAQFAKGCGVSAATIRRIENGDANVKLSTADKLLRYMNITLIDLLPPLTTESPIAEGKERPRNKKVTPAPQGEVTEKKILFSELLANIPSDEVLTELLPDPYRPQRALTMHSGLEVLKLRLEGLNTAQTAERLHMTVGQADHRIRKTVRQLTRYIPENIVIDIPALRKILGIQPFHFTGRYTKLSELLRDMPSDEVLFQLDRERGNLNGDRKRHRVSNQDLYLLQQRQAGRTYRSIGEELGMSPKAVRHRILRIKVVLKWYLAVDLDVPALFN